jgi:AAA15 family ATPase/GTPase
MINSVHTNNFGPLTDLQWNNLGNINLILGPNSCGKTFLLKALYSAIRTLEDYKRGDDQRTASEILQEKLYWTFQSDKIGDIVTKGAESPLSFKMQMDNYDFCYSFGSSTVKQISELENHNPKRESNSIFLPAKEVLSIHHIILKSREIDKVFGFDDTYLDLARAIRQSPKKGKNFDEFAKSRQKLEEMIGGKIEFDELTGKWLFKKGNAKFTIGSTAEGIKKIAIVDTLLGNRYLDDKSVVFIDEPESALHPDAIDTLLEIVALLAERGIQFFMASHSYFVVKKLLLIAMEKNLNIPVISYQENQWNIADLRDGMPTNSIIQASIDLYMKEVQFQTT